MPGSRKLATRLGLLLGFGLLMSASLWQTYHWVLDNELNRLQQRVDADLRRYAVTLSNEIDKFQSLPHLLATNPDLEWLLLAPQNQDRLQQLNLYFEQVAKITGASDIYLMDQDATTIAASNWHQETTFIGSNFSYRPYFTQAITGTPGRYFALGTTSRKRGYYFSYPVSSRDKILGVVVVKIDLDDIEDQWTDPILDLLVTDNDGIIFISTRPEWKFSSINSLSPGDIARIQQSRRYPDQRLGSLPIQYQTPFSSSAQLIALGDNNGQANPRDYLMMDLPMPAADLHVVGLAKLTEVQARVRGSLLLTAGLLSLLLLLVSYLTQRRRITLERQRFKQQASATLEANEARIRAILDNTQAGIITLGSHGRIETINPTAEKLLGYGPGELLGSQFLELIYESSHSRLQQGIEQGAIIYLETQAYRADGSMFPLEISVSDLDYRDQHKAIITLHDITERKGYEESLRRARDELEVRVAARTEDLTQANSKLKAEINKHRQTQNELIQAAKLAVLGQLSAGINHELNQPLTAIRAYADNGRQFLERDNSEIAKQNLAEISALTEHMSKIIAPLKIFSRNTTGQAEPVSLKSIHDGALSILYGKLDQAQVTINWPASLHDQIVMGDMVRLEQVVVNLISNAMEAMETTENKQLDIEVSETENWLTLEFHDHGPGIPTEQLSRIFEPFFTTKAIKQQGLGLGLSISQRIVENFGGSLTVYNHRQGGAVFALRLKKAHSTTFRSQ